MGRAAVRCARDLIEGKGNTDFLTYLRDPVIETCCRSTEFCFGISFAVHAFGAHPRVEQKSPPVDHQLHAAMHFGSHFKSLFADKAPGADHIGKNIDLDMNRIGHGQSIGGRLGNSK